MPRKPLPIGSWGRISRTPMVVVDGRNRSLLRVEGRYYLPDDVARERPMKPTSWVARARFRDLDGVTRKVEAWGSSATAAETSLVTTMQGRVNVTDSEIKPDTRLSVVGDKWLVRLADSTKLAVNTKERYRIAYEGHIKPGIGSLTVAEATAGKLGKYIDRVTASTGAATARLCRSVLVAIMQLAVEDEAISANPVRDVKVEGAQTAEVRALTADEVKQLRKELRDDRKSVLADLPDLVDMLLATGVRIGELLAVQWSDIDLENSTIAVTGTVVRAKGTGLYRQDTTKGKKPRKLILPKFATTLLTRRAESGPYAGELNLVFPSATDGLREVATVERQWRLFRQRHPEWQWVTLHVFRKTVATLIDREKGTKIAASQLGHSSEAVTTKHYIQRMETSADVSDVLEKLAS